jgi:hypothetical protein
MGAMAGAAKDVSTPGYVLKAEDISSDLQVYWKRPQ